MSRSVVDQIREKQRAWLGTLSAGDRVVLALKLGDDDWRLLAAARPLDPGALRSLLERARCRGRRASRCMDDRFQ